MKKQDVNFQFYIGKIQDLREKKRKKKDWAKESFQTRNKMIKLERGEKNYITMNTQSASFF